jgi:hypothetical protein
MRRAWVLALMAATVAVPVPAMAQDSTEETRAERRQARQERREQRQQERADRPVARNNDGAAQGQRREERREARRDDRPQRQAPTATPSWIGDPNDPHRARYERQDRENARRHGTPEQYRRLVEQQRAERREERRDDRRDWREERRENRQEWRGERREERRDDRRDWRDDRREDRRDWRQDRRQDRREFRQERREWNRDWRRDQRFDWQRYRQYNRSIFRAPSYYAPYRGYRYNRFSVGAVLDALLFGRNYWISDPWHYRLPPAPYGFQWVRYYNDVILVDTYNGRVVDVIYDFFW